MSGTSPISARPDHAPGYKAIKFNWDWVTRPWFGGALAARPVAAHFGGPLYIALFARAGRRRRRARMAPHAGRTGFRSHLLHHHAHRRRGARRRGPPAGVARRLDRACRRLRRRRACYAMVRGHHPVWHGAGPLYLGLAMLALLLLRASPHGAWVIVGMFIAIWSTDTGALFTGNLVGGPRLWPAISPSKTWAGTFGGIATGAVFEAVYIAVLGGRVVPAALLGAAIAAVSAAGDLFESWVKRKFQRKDSGGMIPGHGGVLDRIDSTLFAAPVLAFFVIVVGLNPMFGAHP